MRDTDPVTLRALMHEFESNGLVEVTLNSHTCSRPEGWAFTIKAELKMEASNTLQTILRIFCSINSRFEK